MLFITLLVILIILMALMIRVVPQGSSYVVQRLGRY